MAQKFIGLDDAANQLGVSKERLNEIREAGKLRAYRDGASWKFRAEDIEKIAAEGAGESGPGSDAPLALDEPEEVSTKSSGLSDLGLDFGDDATEQSLGGETADKDKDEAASDISLADVEEPTVAAEGEEGEDDAADSILLSETELGDASDRPPSTIIGKVDLGPESDLDLVLEPEGDAPHQSDVRLAEPDSAVLSSESTSSAATPAEDVPPESNFDDIEELEIDLEAESSRILSPEDVAKAQQAADTAKSETTEDLDLAASDSDAGPLGTSSIDASQDTKQASDAGLTGISEIGVGQESGSTDMGLTGISALELDDDDDDGDEGVLGDGSDSDITLSTGDSGINIVSPSDSGLALDDASLDLSGSAIGSPLDLGEADEDISLEPLGTDAGGESASGPGEDFLLTPTTEESAGEEADDSSQVIALDEVAESEGADDLLGGSQAAMLGDDFSTTGLAAADAASVTASESDFTVWNVMFLTCCTLLLAVCGMMMVDLMRNIWSWNETYSLNSTLIDGLLSFF